MDSIQTELNALYRTLVRLKKLGLDCKLGALYGSGKNELLITLSGVVYNDHDRVLKFDSGALESDSKKEVIIK